ncbi:MAG: hypothetical protein EXS05_07590 [Planctomycetaceae bacterium]|nr:hypothetical protein [Planctomycetaceae bacterium]
MAQAMKSQLVAELEYKNLLLERSLIQSRNGDIDSAYNEAIVARDLYSNAEKSLKQIVDGVSTSIMAAERDAARTAFRSFGELVDNYVRQQLTTATDKILSNDNKITPEPSGRAMLDSEVIRKSVDYNKTFRAVDETIVKNRGRLESDELDPQDQDKLRTALDEVEIPNELAKKIDSLKRAVGSKINVRSLDLLQRALLDEFDAEMTSDDVNIHSLADDKVRFAIRFLRISPENFGLFRDAKKEQRDAIQEAFTKAVAEASEVVERKLPDIIQAARLLKESKPKLAEADQRYRKADEELQGLQQTKFAIRILEQSIDEKEQKSVELLEAMRSHVANVDNYLKRLATALEDDIAAQFYSPAFQEIRRASRYWDVNLGQIETTTILTNNRAFAKVNPSATVEFDLPQRDILITEAMKGFKGVATEYGNLLQDHTFLAGTAMLQGQPAANLTSSQSPLQQVQGVGGPSKPEFGAALQALIPDPSVYKFETGTGFEIRPVIQPDGHSIVYGFDYMYTTNVREPVRADEKHLGRVKRHFIHTDVQTSSYELREVSRYVVALKASRTSKGVPLLEDVPVIGGLFRPLPSQESSLQENIILASSVIYPTLYDLAGLRWSPYADEIHSTNLADSKDREKEIDRRYRNNLLRKARERVNENIGGDLQLPAELRSSYREPPAPPENVPIGPRMEPHRQPGSSRQEYELDPGETENIESGPSIDHSRRRIQRPQPLTGDALRPMAPQAANSALKQGGRQRRDGQIRGENQWVSEPPPTEFQEAAKPEAPGRARVAPSNPASSQRNAKRAAAPIVDRAVEQAGYMEEQPALPTRSKAKAAPVPRSKASGLAGFFGFRQPAKVSPASPPVDSKSPTRRR